MQKYLFYDEFTGEAKFLFMGTLDTASLQDGAFIECSDGVSPKTHYVDLRTNMAESKVSHSYTIQKIGLTVVIEGLPPGISICTEYGNVVTDSDITEIEFALPGTYTIIIKGSVQYLQSIERVTVNG